MHIATIESGKTVNSMTIFLQSEFRIFFSSWCKCILIFVRYNNNNNVNASSLTTNIVVDTSCFRSMQKSDLFNYCLKWNKVVILKLVRQASSGKEGR